MFVKHTNLIQCVIYLPAYLLSLAVSSSALNDFKSLHSPAIFSHHNFLSFLYSTLTVILPPSCGRNQATISFQIYPSTCTILTNS